jgi:hypothetical protein
VELLARPALAALAALLAGCGASSANRVPTLTRLPLADGARVVVRIQRCNEGTAAYCSLQLVVATTGSETSRQLMTDEIGTLRRRGWRYVNPTTGLERAADSPGGRLHVIFATANGDLEAIDLGWIRRARPVTLALSRALFTHTPTLSMLLEDGTG